jgi:hypothetical protein
VGWAPGEKRTRTAGDFGVVATASGGMIDSPLNRRMNLSCNVLRNLKGLQQFSSLQILNISMNCIADPRQLLHLPPSLTALQLQGNPCCQCPCSYMAALAACPAIKTIDTLHVPHWHVSVAASAVALQVSLPQALAGVSVMYRAVAAVAKQAAVNAEFVSLFGQQRYDHCRHNHNHHHHQQQQQQQQQQQHRQQQQQQQQQQSVHVFAPGLSAARVIFRSLIAAAHAFNTEDDTSLTSSSSSSSSFAAVAALSSLPSLPVLLASGDPSIPNPPNARIPALNPAIKLITYANIPPPPAATLLVPSIALQPVDMHAVVSSRAGTSVLGPRCNGVSGLGG